MFVRGFFALIHKVLDGCDIFSTPLTLIKTFQSSTCGISLISGVFTRQKSQYQWHEIIFCLFFLQHYPYNCSQLSVLSFEGHKWRFLVTIRCFRWGFVSYIRLELLLRASH